MDEQKGAEEYREKENIEWFNRDLSEDEEVEEEKVLEELLQDKLGDPRRQSEDFWRGQGRSPTLPDARRRTKSEK